uniref:Uncharacterized protein n=1 Tax=Lepeophtheirus salmonis TaxID=72036 RepID=A0A0K2U5W4_LEPSM
MGCIYYISKKGPNKKQTRRKSYGLTNIKRTLFITIIGKVL